jgi:hypothetical protein
MDAVRVGSRFRIHAIVEWLIAAAFLFATLAVAAMIMSEMRGAPASAGKAAESRTLVSSIPAAVPARAVSVPVLPFIDGKEIRVGETFAAVVARLGRAAESGRQEVDRGPLGERLTRFYEYAGSRFIVVYEPFERNGDVRVAAIYLP